MRGSSNYRHSVGAAPSFLDMVVSYGTILFTERFVECRDFYLNKLGLPVWFEKEGLCCLRFGAGYLMIESGGVGRDRRKFMDENPTILRFNVPNVKAAAAVLEAKGIRVDIKEHDWGIVGVFLDPDGNVCGLKNSDDPFFAD